MSSNTRLIGIVDRLERLEQEKKAIAEDISDVKHEAKSAGFDVKMIGQMLRERAMGAERVREQLALAEIYRAALGMLDGTPLGEWARKRLSEPAEKPDETPSEESSDAAASESPQNNPAPQPLTAEQLTEARLEGAQARLDGKKVTDNPHPANDLRRAAWDEGWCAQDGSDGMDVPKAFQRKKKPEGGGQP